MIPKPAKINLISYNVEYGKRLPEIIFWLSTYSPLPDLVCLQEFPASAINTLSKALRPTSFGLCFADATTKKGSVHGELTLYNSRKISCLEFKTGELGTVRLEKILSRHSGRKTCLTSTMRAGNHTFHLTNLHLGCITNNTTRLNQLKTCLSFLPESNTTSLVVGDFNYSNILGNKKLTDYMSDHGYFPAKINSATHKKLILRQQLDYIFFKNCAITNQQVIHLPYSDHYPFKVDISLGSLSK